MMLIINQQHREQTNKNHCCYESNDNDDNPAADVNPADDDDDDYKNHNDTTTMDNANSNCNNKNSDDDARLVATLGDYDVLCGRHKAAFNNTGNRRFRITVSLSLSCFMKATSRKEKNTVIKSILKIVQGNGGRFLEYDKKINAFVELTTKKAHMKVGHALRDMALANRKELVVENGTSSNNNSNNNNAGIQIVLAAKPSDATAMAVVPTTTIQSYPDTTTPLHNNYVEQPVMDPWDLLESSIPATSSGATNGGGPLPHRQQQQQQPVGDQQHDLDMLQWLVGESDGLLRNNFDCPEQMITMSDEEPPLLSVTDVPQQYQQQQQHYQSPLPFSNSATTSTDTFLPLTTMTTRTTSETTTTSPISIIEPIPLSIGNNPFNSSTMDEKDGDNDNDSHSLRESFVLDDSLLQWLVGESNDLTMDRFEMV